MRFPATLPLFLRTMLLLMLVVGTAVRPTLVMICELQGAFAGEGGQAQLDQAAAATAPEPADDHPTGHAHGSHGVLQNIAPDSVAAILPAFALPLVYQQAMPMPDMTVSAPPPQPAAEPFRPPIG